MVSGQISPSRKFYNRYRFIFLEYDSDTTFLIQCKYRYAEIVLFSPEIQSLHIVLSFLQFHNFSINTDSEIFFFCRP
jgi:hypothetical protein